MAFVFTSELEPTELLQRMVFSFRDSSSNRDDAKARWKEEFAARREARTERMERREAAKKAKAKPPPKAPVSALPGVVAYFYRTLQMLQGVGTLLEVQVSFVQPMAACAKHALLEHSRRQLRASARPTPTPTPLTPPPAEGGTGADLELVTGRGKRADLANAVWSANVLARAESIVAGATPPVTELGGDEAPPPSSVGRARGSLQRRVERLLAALTDTSALLGAQVAVYHDGNLVVDASCGRRAPTDAAAVDGSDLFQVFEAGAPVVAALAVRLAATGDPAARAYSLDAPISSAWPEFKGTATLETSTTPAPPPTVAQLLSHSITALATAAPARAKLADLCDLDAMSAHVAAAGAAAAGEAAAYEGAPWGWAVAGLLKSAGDGATAATLLADLAAALNVGGHLRLSLPPAAERAAAGPAVVTHSAGGLTAEVGMKMALAAAAGPGGDEGGGDGAAAPAAAEASEGAEAAPAALERFAGSSQLAHPATLNSEQLRAAAVPGASFWASARGLAAFYAALGAGRLYPLRELTEGRAATGTFLGRPTKWSLGLQVTALGGERAVTAVGHAATGGTIAFAVPERGLAVAITTSKLASEPVATRKVLKLVLAEYGLGAAAAELV